ncbi:regulatory subunit of cyclin-dependent kinase [Fimicolochytrium jonesii]|uniref:regulatory subunit of cyclin-dependent kinase n=1 Tax=Fimicolochytrium jonesii TaxID=1396493 RepID=UPI0022FEC5B4|nr:regulatory subunit of cyclin-dependent kinase [Fimicolochytrium jonesii]KAI8823339.1 regulatory subunit of cyclin-dependent kinase [Fimicolochytrium jonesii]
MSNEYEEEASEYSEEAADDYEERAAQKLNDIEEHRNDIYYSPRYQDDEHEYRHVTLPKQIAAWIPKGRLMPDAEWRSYGVQQSAGWEHYMIHGPEPHILLFRREKDYQIKYPNGKPAPAPNPVAKPQKKPVKGAQGQGGRKAVGGLVG